MKPFDVYQWLEGEEMTERDKKEAGSKFWNKGKWDNFVKPFLKVEPEQTLVDMGCNKGLFLKLAADMGFRAIGIDYDEEAVRKGIEWRNKNNYTYDIRLAKIEKCIDELPAVDYTVLANSHYYFTVNDFLDYLDKLQLRTRYCIVVTDEKHHLNRCWASADVTDIRSFFRNWEEVGFIDVLPQEGPSPRKLRSLCFRSKWVDRIPIDKLDSSNHVQDSFYGELDTGTHYTKTRYYRILLKYRRKWGTERLNQWTEERIKVYEDIKKYGLKVPLIVDKENRILDGNHRCAMMRTLGHKYVFVRRV